MPNYRRLQEGNTDYATHWRLIKTYFSKAIPKQEDRSSIRIKNGERGIWQRHYWEHWIRGEFDFKQHFDYIHRNPVKHKLVNRIVDWPHLTGHNFMDCVRRDN
jgi:putative transposase